MTHAGRVGCGPPTCRGSKDADRDRPADRAGRRDDDRPAVPGDPRRRAGGGGVRARLDLGLRPPAVPLRRRNDGHPRVLDGPVRARRGDVRVELGTIVMCTGFRNPALLAKMAATLDHISGGRLILGIGCGWHDPEFEAFGFPTDHRSAGRGGPRRDPWPHPRWAGRPRRTVGPGRRRGAAPARPARDPDPHRRQATAHAGAHRAHADAWNLAWFGAPDERLATARATWRPPAQLSAVIPRRSTSRSG